MDVMIRRRELMGMQGVLKTVSGPIVTVSDALARNAKSLIVNFAPVQASGTPSPDNVLPISGWTGVTGYRTGKNIFDAESFCQNLSNNFSYNQDGGIHVKVPYTAGWIGQPVSGHLAEGTYTVSVDGTQATNDVDIRPTSGAWYGWTALNGRQTHTVTSNMDYLLRPTSASAGDDLKIQLEVGTTPTTYAPYTGTAYPVDWTDIAGTVYGGYVDLVSGVLRVDRAGFNAKNVTWTDAGSGRLYTKLSQSPTNLTSPLCSHCEYHRRPGAGAYDNWIDWGGYPDSNKNLFVTLKDITTTLSTWQTYIQNNDVEFVYELATPITYQLTPQTIAMLKGTNNVWSNANGDTELTYYAQ